MAAFNYRLECKFGGSWAQFSGGFDLAACKETADYLHTRDGEPVRVVSNRTGRVAYRSKKRRSP